MIAINSQTGDRMPVWRAFSDLFLDTDLQAEDFERIARILAASPYSEKKLEEILRFEVRPVLKWNLMSMAGEWAGFDEAWLQTKLTPRIDRRPLFRFGSLWMVGLPWPRIRQQVSALRMK